MRSELRAWTLFTAIVAAVSATVGIVADEPTYFGLTVISAVLSGLSWLVVRKHARVTRFGAGGLGVALAGAAIAFAPIVDAGFVTGAVMMVTGALVFALGYNGPQRSELPDASGR